MSQPTVDQVKADVEAFVDANWDPEDTVGEWWQKLADSGYAHPMLPEEAGGKGWGVDLNTAVMRTIAKKGVLGPPTGLGMMLAAPTIAAHGSPEQIQEYIPKILNGEEAWCQLFSEPGAGSDLAGLQCKAELDGEEWLINGQKVWTSGGQVADKGMLIARTDPAAPKHRGISYFAFDMDQPGVDVRPLKEITGRAMFNEVFIDDGRVLDSARIGELGDGWRVANTTLMVERSSLGGGSVPMARAGAGSIMNHRGRKCSEFTDRARGEDGVPGVSAELVIWLAEIADKLGRGGDPVVRDELMKMYMLCRVNRMNILRAKAYPPGRTGAEGNIAKLNMSEMYRGFREVGNLVIGAEGMLVGDDSEYSAVVQEITLFSPGPSIYGGTDQVQRNIIGERVLGLPKEPGPDKTTPFNQLLQN